MIDLIIPFKNADINRERNLKYVLKMYIDNVKNLNVYIVEQDTYTDLSEFNINYIHVNFNNDAIHKSECYNIGVKASSSEYLILADSDIVVDINFLKNIENYFDSTNLVIPFNKPFIMLTDDETNKLVSDNIIEGVTERGTQNISGILLMSRRSFYEIGGYDPQFIGWGPEDIAFYYKAEKILGVKILEGRVYHMYHDKAPKVIPYKKRRKLLYDIQNMSYDELIDYISELKRFFYE